MAFKESFAIYNYFGGAYRYHDVAYCLKQVSQYIILKSTNNILNITLTLMIS